MSGAENGAMRLETGSLVATFHRVGSLIPPGQELATIAKDTTVAQALRIMEERHFSQLPVTAGRALLGVFSYRSFSQEAARRQRKERNTVLADLPVEEFMEDFPYAAPGDDWTKIHRHLDEKDGLFVGHSDDFEGLITTMDVYHYFRDIADPFILIAEIEETLRGLIVRCIPDKERREVLERNLAGAYSNGVPRRLVDLTLNDFVLVVTAQENWKYFGEVLGKGERDRNYAVAKLKDVPDLRNDAFHFKRKLSPREMKVLADCRNWLYRAVRAYEGVRQNAQQSQAPPTLTAPHPIYEHLAAQLTPAARDFYHWLVAEIGRRPLDFDVKKSKGSFSVRWRASGTPASFAFAYAPDKLSVYLADLKLVPDELAGLRRALLRFGVFVESGKHTLNAPISQVDGTRLRNSCLYLLDWLAGIGNK